MLTAEREESCRRIVSSGGDLFATDARAVLAELDRVRAEHAADSAAYAALSGEARGCAAECVRLREDLAAAEGALETYRKRQEELWEENEALRDAQAEMKADIEYFANGRDRLQDKLSETQDSLKHTEGQWDAVAGTLAGVRAELERAEADRSRLRKRVAELEARHVEYVREPQGDGEARRVREENVRLLGELAHAEARAELAESAAAAALSERNSLAERVRSLGVA